MKLNVWKQAQELEALVLHLESRINDLESTIAAVLSNRKTDKSMISKDKAEELAERKAKQRIKSAAYARKYYQKKKAERQEAK
jgi:hypothetical protein